MFINYSLAAQHILGQVQLEGLEKAAQTSPLNGALVGFIIILLTGIVFLFKEYKSTQQDLKMAQQEHIKKIEEVRKEMSESEKETLKVLNAVSSILEMSEKMGQNDTQKILETVKNTEEKIIELIKNLGNK